MHPLLLLVPAALGHVYLPLQDNFSPATAQIIEDPIKSHAVYGDFLSAKETRYFSFYMAAGDLVSISLFKPVSDEDTDFSPFLALLGPANEPALTIKGGAAGLTPLIPAGTALPASGWGASQVVRGDVNGTLVYEAFGPSSYEWLGNLTYVATAAGNYHIVAGHVGDHAPYGYPKHFGFSLGTAEQFTAMELIRMPIDMWSVHVWERQSTSELVIPLFLALVAVLAAIFFRALWLQLTPTTLAEWALVTGGAMYWVSAILYWYQMLRAASITGTGSDEPVLSLVIGGVHAVFSVGPLIVGLDSLEREGEFRWWWRILLVVQSIASLFVFGAGLYVGPALVALASITPDDIGYATCREVLLGIDEELVYYYDDYYYEVVSVPPQRPVYAPHHSRSRLRRNRSGWNY